MVRNVPAKVALNMKCVIRTVEKAGRKVIYARRDSGSRRSDDACLQKALPAQAQRRYARHARRLRVSASARRHPSLLRQRAGEVGHMCRCVGAGGYVRRSRRWRQVRDRALPALREQREYMRR